MSLSARLPAAMSSKVRWRRRSLERADIVAVALPLLCELVWVLSQGYKIAADDIAGAVRTLTSAANVMVYRPAVEADWCFLIRWMLPTA
jgi:hypothetical protein